jgi:CHAD domain-containing protein
MASRASNGPSDRDDSEIQLTLLFDPASYRQLDELPLLRDGWKEPQRSKVSVTYFDGPDRPLTNSNVSLRVEGDGQAYRQHLEAEIRQFGIARVRRVWESPVPTPEPVLSELADKSLRELLVDQAADTLEPFCSAKLERVTRQMRLDYGGEITAVTDIGEMTVDAAKRPFAELTLKLTSGPRNLPFELGLQIAQRVPLRVAAESPAKRVLALLPGQKPQSHKANALDLSKDATVEDALAHVVQDCLGQILANEACVLESEDPEGVHQMRVAVRRFRSALRIFRAALPSEQYAWLNDELRFLTDQIVAARDWDVFADEIAGPAAAGAPDEKALQTFLDRTNEYRDRSRHAARDAIRSDRYTALLLRASAWLAKPAWRDQAVSETSALLFVPIKAFADNRLTRLHKIVRKAGRNFERLSVSERHQLRIRVKRLRYATEFFSSIYPRKAVKRYNNRLAKLQDALGYLNDVAVAEALVGRVCADCMGEDLARCRFAGGVIIGWHARALADSEENLTKSVKAFVESEGFWSKSS